MNKLYGLFYAYKIYTREDLEGDWKWHSARIVESSSMKERNFAQPAVRRCRRQRGKRILSERLYTMGSFINAQIAANKSTLLLLYAQLAAMSFVVQKQQAA